MVHEAGHNGEGELNGRWEEGMWLGIRIKIMIRIENTFPTLTLRVKFHGRHARIMTVSE